LVGRHDVAYGDYVENRAEQALFDECAENEPTDPAKTIDSHLRAMGVFVRYAVTFLCVVPRGREEPQENTPPSSRFKPTGYLPFAHPQSAAERRQQKIGFHRRSALCPGK